MVGAPPQALKYTVCPRAWVTICCHSLEAARAIPQGARTVSPLSPLSAMSGLSPITPSARRRLIEKGLGEFTGMKGFQFFELFAHPNKVNGDRPVAGNSG